MTLLLDRQTYTRRRDTQTTRDADGRTTPDWQTDEIEGSLQPVEGQELQTLDFGERRRETRKLYTDTSDWQVADAESVARSDQLQVDGEWWEARQVQDWNAFLKHNKVYLTRVQE